ncbi:o-succinylbenzoate synthase [Halanaerobium saccharolyticum]|uniref:Dipeptide epimerase n=1 Tax=Halanaerobium saccharolyticum TaxID=43595 RepID=A0A4R7Z8V0_9FIRM|nr:dipeptide epimerase [Halanaerobium saccharolyticum]RAK11836.1 o-succinylbenzoate synthase [Halanaerobium saccharolyticum]TDW07677.1 o-succinylbenzoate synthase [Halanaerobium saccharolyticum]TDX64598.1 o-succinylbenzoate synthase [Halanaerobium saccharolyticum]
MKITDLKLYKLNVPLKKTFKTAVRSADTAEEVIVIIEGEAGIRGFGEAPSTAVITGDTAESIIALTSGKIRELLLGEEIENLEKLHYLIEASAVNNYSAKAAVEMAVYDLYARYYQIPLYRLLGGYSNQLYTDLTISVNSPQEMKKDALQALSEGYKSLKLKVGKNSQLDLKRIRTIREAVGPEVEIRLDANQGWEAKEAVRIIRKLEAENLGIEFVEQPVKAADIRGLKFVRENVLTPIMADESLFTAGDCITLLEMGACDLLNIKLMKCGGIYNALKINALAEAYGVEVMLGSMLEAKVSVTAAAHLAAAKKNISRVDLDAPELLKNDPVQGGINFSGPKIMISENPGLDIKKVDDLIEL